MKASSTPMAALFIIKDFHYYNKDMGQKKKPQHSIWTIAMAVIFVVAWLGTMLVFFPVGNPFEGLMGSGFFYMLLIAVILSMIILIFYALRSVIMDFLESVGNELGIDAHEIVAEYKNMFKDEMLIILRKKKRVSDHHSDLPYEVTRKPSNIEE